MNYILPNASITVSVPARKTAADTFVTYRLS